MPDRPHPRRRPALRAAFAAAALATAALLAALSAACAAAAPSAATPADADARAAEAAPQPDPAAAVQPPAAEDGRTDPPPPGAGRAAPAPAWRLEPPPELPADRPLRAAFLVVDGVYDTELMAPYDVFHHTRFHTGDRPAIEPYLVSPDGEPIVSFEGITIVPHHGFDDAPAPDVLVVPSAEGSMAADLEDERTIAWVRETGGAARWVVSLCDGAFVLARAGLLDGHAATTFPADYDRFAQLFPQVDLRINVSFVRDGKMLTSQGGVRSYDVAMHLVDHLYGERVAERVGAGLLIPWPPDLDDHPPFTIIPRGRGGQGSRSSAGGGP